MGEFVKSKLYLTVALGKLDLASLKLIPSLLDCLVTFARTDSEAPRNWLLHVQITFFILLQYITLI